MRSFLFAFVLVAPALTSAQIVQEGRAWPCPMPPCRMGQPCPMAACVAPSPTVSRQSSDVRVELVDRVLRYEITETYVNHGN
ncbi:MAG: hypothetical protein ACREMY_01625, partial [bacterium]